MIRAGDILSAAGVTAAAEPGHGFAIDANRVRAAVARLGLVTCGVDEDVMAEDGDDLAPLTVRFHQNDTAVTVRVLEGDIIDYRLPLTAAQLKHVLAATQKLKHDLVSAIAKANAEIGHALDKATTNVQELLRGVKPTSGHVRVVYDVENASVVVDDGTGRWRYQD